MLLYELTIRRNTCFFMPQCVTFSASLAAFGPEPSPVYYSTDYRLRIVLSLKMHQKNGLGLLVLQTEQESFSISLCATFPTQSVLTPLFLCVECLFNSTNLLLSYLI